MISNRPSEIPRREVLYDRSVLVQWMDGPPTSKLLRHPFAKACSAERDHSKENRSPLSDFAVSMLKFFGQGEKLVSSSRMQKNITEIPRWGKNGQFRVKGASSHVASYREIFFAQTRALFCQFWTAN